MIYAEIFADMAHQNHAASGAEVSLENLCVRCVSWVFSERRFDHVCSRKQGISKACTTCANDRRDCVPVPSTFLAKVEELLAIQKEYLRDKYSRGQYEQKEKMAELARDLANRLLDDEVSKITSVPPSDHDVMNKLAALQTEQLKLAEYTCRLLTVSHVPLALSISKYANILYTTQKLNANVENLRTGLQKLNGGL